LPKFAPADYVAHSTRAAFPVGELGRTIKPIEDLSLSTGSQQISQFSTHLLSSPSPLEFYRLLVSEFVHGKRVDLVTKIDFAFRQVAISMSESVHQEPRQQKY